MDTGTSRIGSSTLGYHVAPSAMHGTAVGGSVWGSMPKGVKTILKILFVAAVAATVGYFAVGALLEVPAIAQAAASVGTMLSSTGASLLSGLNAAIIFFGGSPIGAVALAEGTATSIATAAGAASAVVAGAAAMPNMKTAALSSSLVSPAPAPTSIVPDLSNHTNALDPAMLAKKSVLASTAPDHAATTAHASQHHAATSLADLPDAAMNPNQLSQHGDAGKTVKLGHMAEEISERRHHASTRNHLNKIEHELNAWQERVGKANNKPARPSNTEITHTSKLEQRDSSSFANAVDADRERLSQALGTSV